MIRRVFFSFHYQRDIFRVNVVRNSWLTRPDRQSAGYWDASLWETFKRQGDEALQRLINSGLANTSVTVVLIGAETHTRRWVNYEITRSLQLGKGLIGIRIHNIPTPQSTADYPGPDLASIVTPLLGVRSFLDLLVVQTRYPTYDWELDDGYHNMGSWVDGAARLIGR
jgi:hypothetical protein